jgi:hypothetical protein
MFSEPENQCFLTRVALRRRERPSSKIPIF